MTEVLKIQDLEERAIAKNPARSCIVQAPAGSGKTTLLAERYVALLARVEQPEQILAITFTKKAAAEMRERVLEELADADSELGREAIAHARSLNWQLEKYPSRLRIQTIDAFAMSLVKQLPVTSQLQQRDVGAHPERWYHQAVARVLRTVGGDNTPSEGYAPADLLRDFFGNTTQVHNLLVTMLRRREQWQFMLMERLAQFDSDALIAAIAQAVEGLQKNALLRLDACLPLPIRVKLEALAHYAWDNLDKAHEFSDLTTIEQWRFIADSLVLTKGSDFGKLVVRTRITKAEGFPAGTKDPHKGELKELLDELRDEGKYQNLLEALIGLREVPGLESAELDKERLSVIGTVLFNCINELSTLFIERGEVDFNQITIAAITALGTADAPSDLALSLDYRISHLLIDEFQDTSRAQHELFSRLIREWTPEDGNTFFAVGDPMQSIYRFRNAEVSLFLDVCDNGMNDLPLEHLRLSTNFRSNNTMISWFNQIFSQVLGRHNDSNLGAISYSEATSPRGTIDELTWTELASPLQLSETIDEQHEQLISHVKTLSAGCDLTQIAILVRNRTPVGGLVKALELADIPWQGTDLHALSNTAIVSDLVCLAQALFDPGDRVSTFALLRGPLVGLTLNDLNAMARAMEDYSDQTSAHDAQPHSQIFSIDPSGLGHHLSPEGATQVERLQRIAQPLLARRLSLSPRELIETLWLKLGGPAAYPASNLKHASRLFDVIEAGHPTRFDPERLQRDLDKLYAEDDRAGVQILTVHKSKGLQYKHVLLPYLQAGTRAEETQLLMSREAPQGFLMACRAPGSKDFDKKNRTLYHWLKTEDKERAKNETKRLLYVAATRAEESLALFATLETSKKPTNQSLLSTLAPVFGELWQGDDADSKNAPAQPPPKTEPDISIRALPSSLPAGQVIAPAVALPSRARRQNARPSGPELDDPDLLFASERRAAILRGNLIHQALCTLSRAVSSSGEAIDANALASELIERERPLWTQLAENSGFDHDLCAEIADATERGIERVAASRFGRWCVLAAHADSQAELPLTLWEGAGPMKLVVDRTFVTLEEFHGTDANAGTPKPVRWIIDYKTAQPDTQIPSEAWMVDELERYSNQLARYARALGAMHPSQVIRTALYFTAIDELWELRYGAPAASGSATAQPAGTTLQLSNDTLAVRLPDGP